MPRRILQGTVVSDKGDKTVIVSVERRVMHPIYKKYIRRSKRYAAHDPDNRFKVGDVVQIVECRPLSRTKHFEVLAEGAAVTASAPAGVVAQAAASAPAAVAEAGIESGGAEP
jgi:small subunit ribosomal protein S17